jgi:alkanesulfonate monooxygenase SsuD/methylene tetrahydromethanopterin reductase-like flavin-dependent oxidoreductase (luciferase family)
MTLIGYTMMCEQTGPKQLVRDVALAEEAGFDFAVISDHYFPRLEAGAGEPLVANTSAFGRDQAAPDAALDPCDSAAATAPGSRREPG